MATSTPPREPQEFPHFLPRLRVLIWVGVAVALLFLAKLADITLVHGEEYAAAADRSLFRDRLIPAPRGMIVDRHGVVLASNRMVHDVIYSSAGRTRAEIREAVEILTPIFPETMAEWRAIVDERRRFPRRPQTIAEGLDIRDAAEIFENLPAVPGLELEERFVRHYPVQGAGLGHVLGYTRQVNPTLFRALLRREGRDTDDIDWESMSGIRAFANLLAREGYALSDSVGVQGLEAVYEERLRGEKGIERQLQDALSLVIERAVETPAAPGDTLQLTLDLEMQRRGVELLDGRPGALVAVDPRDGGVLALVSSPGFDSDQPVTGRGWGAIATDNVGRPLVNRALREIYSPGSTLKPIVALGALRDDAIEPDTTFFCEGSIEIGGHRFGCDYKDGCGWLSVRRALARSCNVFFYNTMHSSRPRLGQEGWQRVCAEFGLFSPTGIDLPGEVAGHMPQRRLYTGEVIQLGIGQGPFDVTPLQMVMAYARLATGKAFNQPHLVVSATGTGGSVHWQRSPPPNANLPLPNGLMSPERDLVLEGMADVVRTVGGTANRVNFPAAWRVAGKTGSAENRGQIDSWFIAFAPWDDPQIVVGCVVEGAGHGGDVAAPIVRDFLREHFEAPAPQAPELAALP